MQSLKRFALVAAALALAGCSTMSHQQITDLKRSDGRIRVLLMPVDVELTSLTAAGVPEPKADWTEAAREHLLAALREEKEARGINVIAFEPHEIDEPRRQTIDQIVKLHEAVGEAILTHQYGLASRLPTKRGHFDWTLGPAVRMLREEYGADYALFVSVRDSYIGWGRAAFMLVAAAFTLPTLGGTQTGFASLVDLETGDIVWFNRLMRITGDLRTAEAARETAQTLLSGLPP
jgi:hypothetical protein